MKTADGSYHYCYNGQAVIAADYQVIIATTLNSKPTDIRQLILMIEHIVETIGTMPKMYSAGTCHCSAANLEHVKAVEAAHSTEFLISTRRMKLNT